MERRQAAKIGIYPGSFDPTTNGHMDIIQRASKLMDHLVVGVLNNTSKQALFSVEERVALLKELTKDMPNVSIEAFSGLLVDFVAKNNAHVIIRGLRAISDYEFELTMAQTNYSLNQAIETVFLTTKNEYSFLSATIVKEVARYGGAVDHLVPKATYDLLIKKFPIEEAR